MDINQVTGQEKIKMPTPIKQDPSAAVDCFEKTLKKQQQNEQESKVSVTKSDNKVEDLPLQDQKLPSTIQNIEDVKTSSLDLLTYDADHQQEGDEENISDMRNDVAVVLPFMSVPLKKPDQNQLPDDMQDMSDYQSSEKNFLFSPDQDQNEFQKLALNQDQLTDSEKLNTTLEKLSPKDMTVPIKDKGEVLEKNSVSKLPNANKVSVDDIIQSSDIELKPKKVSNLHTLEKAGEDISSGSESTENEFVENSTTVPSKNNEVMSKIFESSSFSHEQNKKFEELALNKDVSSHHDRTIVTEGQIIFKSDNLDSNATLSRTPILTPVRQIEMEIRQAVHNGVHKLEFDLNPLELGKMNIRLNIDAEGHIKALVQAEKFETFEMLQKDTTTRDIILKAFDEAGLIADGTSLHFSHQESNARNQSAGDFLMSFQNQDKEAAGDEENSNLIYTSRTDPSRAYDIFA